MANSELEKLGKKLNHYYQSEGESMFDFETPKGLEILDIALNIVILSEDLKKEVFCYIKSLVSQQAPRREDYSDIDPDEAKKLFNRDAELHIREIKKREKEAKRLENRLKKSGFDIYKIHKIFDKMIFFEFEAFVIIDFIKQLPFIIQLEDTKYIQLQKENQNIINGT